MMKRFILCLMVLLGFIGTKAQSSEQMPLNPNVLHGTLPNGLNYYILHNEEPKNRANFYIAQKVGSSLETPEQLGLAHFLEHMAFNGTKHYPGNKLLNYLESKGIRFGADINAYTSFDETVYNINNVPTTDKALMDSVLLAIYDWSGSILLETDEIDAERGVIQGEYTSSNNANQRMLTAILPHLYEEYQYEQMPIGKMEIIKSFSPETLRNYYKKWYRPDLQGIIIVGDFDAREMEQKVVALFSQIPMPENAAERIYPAISDNAKPIYVTFEDPELQMPRIDSYFKFERTPFEERNTFNEYVMQAAINPMVQAMINNRLDEYSQNPECPYSFATTSIGTFLVSDQKGAYTVIIIPKNDIVAAYKAAMSIITQACKTGFMGTEVQRVRDEILANYAQLYNEKDKTNSDGLGRELIQHFIDNEPSAGIEIEYQLMQMILPQITEEDLNEAASQLVHIENSAVVVSQPSTLGLNVPSEQDMLKSMDEIINADYEPYVDEEITEPLVSNLAAPGKIVSEKSDAKLGIKEFTLSNGVKVVVKPTDFSNDEIIFDMFKPGGKISYDSADAANVIGLDLAIEVSKIGPFNPSQLQKYLAGKKVSVNYTTGRNNNIFTGTSTVKDVEAMFELLYAAFTDVTADPNTYNAYVSQLKGIFANQESSPEFIFQQKMNKALYPNTPVLAPMSLDVINQFNYDRILELYHESVNNAADYTMVIVGNVDEATIKPLLEKYIASLPSTGVKTYPKPKVVITPAPGIIKESIEIKAQNPTVYVFDCISQENLPYSLKNDVMIDLLGGVMRMIFTETLREEMGGTYSPAAWSSINPYTSSWAVNWFVVTTEEFKDAIVKRANAEFEKVMKKGTDNVHFSKVREAAVKQYENNVRTNSYWKDALVMREYGFDSITNHKETLENMTLKDFNNFLKKTYTGKNHIEIVGVAK